MSSTLYFDIICGARSMFDEVNQLTSWTVNQLTNENIKQKNHLCVNDRLPYFNSEPLYLIKVYTQYALVNDYVIYQSSTA